MLTGAQELMTAAPALAVYPDLLILLRIVLVNIVGEGSCPPSGRNSTYRPVQISRAGSIVAER
jgi:hypothetical protein